MTLLRTCVLPDCPGRTELPPSAYACPDCQGRLVRKLADIEAYLDIVSPVRLSKGPGIRSKGFASTPPLNLDVVAMFDPRTEINGASGAAEDDDIVDEVPNVWADLGGWYRILSEEKDDLTAGVPQVGKWWTTPAILRTHIGWIVEQPWVDAFAADIGRVHGALR